MLGQCQQLIPTRHLFDAELRRIGPITHVRLNVFPDGGIARMRVWGEPLLPGGRGLTLPPNSATLFYLQRLRDEAHRFAIGTHRAKRAKSLTTSTLDEVPGIGPNRKRALLMHFGTARAVKGAALDDLEKAPGISKAMAHQLYDYFHPRG